MGHREVDGRPVLRYEAEDSESAERLRRRHRVLKHLEHPGLPRCLDLAEEDGKVVLTCEAPPGESLAARLGRGAKLEPSGALSALKAAADALAYLHAFRPPIPHGRLGLETILVGDDGRVWLVDVEGEGSPEADVRALCDAIASAATALPPLWKSRPPADGPALAEALRSYRLPAPSERDAEPPRSLARLARNTALVGLTLVGSFALGIKVRFEWYPEWSTKRDWAASLKLYQEFGCARRDAVSRPRAGGNLLLNPGLEGPCGWRGKPILKRHVVAEGSHGGRYHLALGRRDWIVQDVALEGMWPPGVARVSVAGWMKGADGGVEVAALKADGSEQHLGGLGFRASDRWTNVTGGEWTLPSGTKRLRLYLDGNRGAGGWFSKTRFDDFELRASGVWPR